MVGVVERGNGGGAPYIAGGAVVGHVEVAADLGLAIALNSKGGEMSVVRCARGAEGKSLVAT